MKENSMMRFVGSLLVLYFILMVSWFDVGLGSVLSIQSMLICGLMFTGVIVFFLVCVMVSYKEQN